MRPLDIAQFVLDNLDNEVSDHKSSL